MKKMKKHVPFAFLNKGTPSVIYFLKIPSPLIWNVNFMILYIQLKFQILHYLGNFLI